MRPTLLGAYLQVCKSTPPAGPFRYIFHRLSDVSRFTTFYFHYHGEHVRTRHCAITPSLFQSAHGARVVPRRITRISSVEATVAFFLTIPAFYKLSISSCHLGFTAIKIPAIKRKEYVHTWPSSITVSLLPSASVANGTYVHVARK